MVSPDQRAFVRCVPAVSAVTCRGGVAKPGVEVFETCKLGV